MKSALHSLEFEMLPSLGVNRHVKREWQTIAREFGGIGLHSLSIKQFISWTELILQHYHTKLTVSTKIKASLQALQLEIGNRQQKQPLQQDFGDLAI
jgi:hypothetical protein